MKVLSYCSMEEQAAFGKILDEAVAAEREACAQIVERSGIMPAHLVGALGQIAAAIRWRNH